MSLKAVLGSEQLEPNALRWTFRVANEHDMRTLGAAFARAVLPPRDRKALRIGLCSNAFSMVGKTTFATGMLETLSEKKSLEHDFIKAQNVWYDAKAGWIRHYDCGYDKGMMLPSYRNNKGATSYGLPFTDIVEHPHLEMHNKKFDYLVFFRREGASWSEDRHLTFAATPKLARSQRFQNFLKKCAHWMVKPANDNAAVTTAPKPPPSATPT